MYWGSTVAGWDKAGWRRVAPAGLQSMGEPARWVCGRCGALMAPKGRVHPMTARSVFVALTMVFVRGSAAYAAGAEGTGAARDAVGLPIVVACGLAAALGAVCWFVGRRSARRAVAPLLSRLEASDVKFRALFDGGTDAIYLFSDVLEDCNTQACRQWGSTREAILGRSPVDFSPEVQPDGRASAEAWQAYADAAHAGEPQSFPWQHRRTDGTLVDAYASLARIELSGHALLLGSSRDISHRKQAEADRVRLATAIAEATEVVMITDRRGTIEYVNPAFETITGYTCEEAIGQTPRLLQSGKHDPAFYQNLWDTVTRGDVWSGRMTNRRKDGRLYEEESIISPVHDPDGRITGFVTVKRDVTRLLKLEQDLRRAQKLEALGTLAGGVAHHFNNTLAAILGNAELVAQRLPTPDPLQRNVQGIIRACERAIDMVRQMLVFGQHTETERGPVEIGSLTMQSLHMIRPLLPETVDIRARVPANVGAVVVGATDMQQVLLNLAVNGAQAMDNNGVLTVSVAPVSPEMDVPPALDRPGVRHYVRLSVQDHGCGMDEETSSRIFEPYFTTREVNEGAGLGLSVVHGLVRILGGDITVETAPGAGSTFHVFLPLAVAGARARRSASGAPPGDEDPVLVTSQESPVVGFQTCDSVGSHQQEDLGATRGGAA